MNIIKADWPYALHPMLSALSNAHFVAIDFELSGISHKGTSKVRDDHPSASRKQTLQERYGEVKAAAEKYQILQMGITMVKEDVERGKILTNASLTHLSVANPGIRSLCSPAVQLIP